MKDLRARLVAFLPACAFACAAWLLGATSAAAAPITIGTFELQNDTLDPMFTGPTFVVFNTSVDALFPGFAAIFGSVHLVLDLLDSSTQDFLLADAVDPGGSVDSNGVADDLGNSLLPDLGSVLDAYLTLTLIDPSTGLALAGITTLAPTDPPLCSGCTNKMTDLTHMSTLAIRFEPDTESVPEPASLLLLGSGVAAWSAKRRWASRS